METQTLLLAHADIQLKNLLEKSVLIPAGYDVTYARDVATAKEFIQNTQPDMVILGESLPDGSGLEIVTELFHKNPHTPILLITAQPTPAMLQEAIRSGINDCLVLPIKMNDVYEALERMKTRKKTLEDWAHIAAHQRQRSLHLEADQEDALLNAVQTISHKRDIENTLSAIVNASIELTQADAGYIMLVDESTEELVIRSSHNLPDELVSRVHISIDEYLAGNIIQSGKPLIMHEETAKMILPSYLANSLISMPLNVNERIIGILGVDRQSPGRPFAEHDLTLVNTLAMITNLVLENAFQIGQCETELYKLQNILTQMENGIILVGMDGRILLINHYARQILGLDENYLEGKYVKDVLRNPDLLEVLDDPRTSPSQTEINIDDGRVYLAQNTHIPAIGLAIILQDITYLKELDQIKTDFVNTVSHDLRSPLTAILGYAELIDRAGPITPQQLDFIHRIQFSANNITALLNDLLELGRIEAGFDSRKEIVHLETIATDAVENLGKRLSEKEQTIEVDIPEHLPVVLGNPFRLKQMMLNILNNSIKFTQPQGKLTIRAKTEADQVILEIIDNGPGIPASDQVHVFDKFYRGSNVPPDVPGTGLGLAIVKSIVDNHQGRIWVDSRVGQGTTVTIVLPISR